jgi:hypothetical protein
VKCIERALLLSHESLAGSPGELREGAETASRSHGILQHAPAAFAWVEMVPTMGQGSATAMAPAARPQSRGKRAAVAAARTARTILSSLAAHIIFLEQCTCVQYHW